MHYAVGVSYSGIAVEFFAMEAHTPADSVALVSEII